MAAVTFSFEALGRRSPTLFYASNRPGDASPMKRAAISYIIIELSAGRRVTRLPSRNTARSLSPSKRGASADYAPLLFRRLTLKKLLLALLLSGRFPAIRLTQERGRRRRRCRRSSLIALEADFGLPRAKDAHALMPCAEYSIANELNSRDGRRTASAHWSCLRGAAPPAASPASVDAAPAERRDARFT